MDNKANVIAIAQAKMGSSRFPEKIMKDIVGKPLLWLIVDRLTYSKLINKIVVTTGELKENDVIEGYVKSIILSVTGEVKMILQTDFTRYQSCSVQM